MAPSKGAKLLREQLVRLFGENSIVEEYHVGGSLRLDYYVKPLRIGFEYHGRQHREYVEHFHGNKAGFARSVQRDMMKEEFCEIQGIGLVIVWFDEEVDDGELLARIKGASTRARDPLPKRAFPSVGRPRSPSFNPEDKLRSNLSLSDEQKEKARAYRRIQYQRMKELKEERKRAKDE